MRCVYNVELFYRNAGKKVFIRNRQIRKCADSYAVCCPISPEKATANYSNRVLKVTVPYQQPLEKAVDVTIE
ncbi:putative small heat shock protein [Methanosarcina lacustris Z-7289]|uniref:Putative small heat shock protein n=1 Tax=Methanosarcina lacustris Z-7289 TaxID=1434111 RepID=A0A0E3WSA3_9EURY|nr:putative small heat shock protein [Methanosarcina lacustris Z-7289]